jgi:hypothetical protein
MHAQSNHHKPLPNAAAYASMNIDELMGATMRLADLLMLETECLTTMRIREIEGFQKEKLDLTTLIEQYQSRIATDPSFLANVEIKKREELLLMTDDLAFAVEENFRHTAVARSVNQRVMHAIRDALTESQSIGTYDRQGQTGGGSDLTLSMNLNQKA